MNDLSTRRYWICSALAVILLLLSFIVFNSMGDTDYSNLVVQERRNTDSLNFPSSSELRKYGNSFDNISWEANLLASHLEISIPEVKGEIYVEKVGEVVLKKGTEVKADITWEGEGHVMLLYTKETYDESEIFSLVERGILPLTSPGKTFAGSNFSPSLTANFVYQQQNKSIQFNFMTTQNKPLNLTNNVPENGRYIFYIIADGSKDIRKIEGGINF